MIKQFIHQEGWPDTGFQKTQYPCPEACGYLNIINCGPDKAKPIDGIGNVGCACCRICCHKLVVYRAKISREGGNKNDFYQESERNNKLIFRLF